MGQGDRQGVVYCIQEWAKDKRVQLADLTYIVSGYGNVGSWTARLMKRQGAKLVAVEDHTGAIANPRGIDADTVADYVKATGGVRGFPGGQPVEHHEFLSMEADVFVPATLENQITATTAPLLKVWLVAEGANGPTDPDGDRILQEKGIDVLPDVLCNAGGVIVSYFEWLQNKRSEFWDLAEVDAKLHRILVAAYARVRDRAREVNTDWRTTAYIVALSRLEKVYTNRGIFP
ncbi:MAG: glutamate dehydrogenase [Candidatus Acetothermia bacterium]|nr:glutamate dehydrogenase [Candidatus Acetothermia bacterium]